jgi:hypothetical protein
MRWILSAGVVLSMMACSHATLRCEGSLQPINAAAAPSPKPLPEATPGRASP